MSKFPIHTKRGVITFQNGVIVKTGNQSDSFQHLLKNNWLMHYNKIRQINPSLVEIYSVSSNTIEMEYIENVELADDVVNYDEFDKYQIIPNMLDVINKVWVSGLKHVIEENYHFLHTDLGLWNTCISTNNSIRVLDPDSFYITPSSSVPFAFERYILSQMSLTNKFVFQSNFNKNRDAK